MTLSEELQWRGFINQTTFRDLSQLDKQKWTFYHGFDASADSQTIGNLAGMMLDKAFIRHGHKAILLAGGATSLIGDPGGKDSERPLQDEATIRQNVAKAEQQLKRVFSGQDFTLVNNLDWTKDLTVLEFLRNVGKHFSMTPLVQRDYIAKRMGEEGGGISFAELTYTLLQGMDFLHLFDTYNCNLQLSGSDQWGNCLSGIELIRKTRGAEVHALTMPLVINKTTGKKFGKSEDGAVWLDVDKTSVYQFYQFWLNLDDEGVEGYLKIYTELPKNEIDKVMREFIANPAQRLAQKTLAYEVTKLVHGEKEARSVQASTESVFVTKEYDFNRLKEQFATVTVKDEQKLLDVLVDAGLASSKSEARRFFEQGAVYLNDQQIQDVDKILSKRDTIDGKHALIRRGKNSTAVISFV